MTILRVHLLLATSATISAFQIPERIFSPTPDRSIPTRRPTTLQQSYRGVDLSENANRDINSMHEWGYGYGVQQAEAFQLTSWDGYDFFAMAGADVPAGTCVLYVPRSIFLTSDGSKQEFGPQEAAEKLIGSLAGSDQYPLFYLFLKILVEYELGKDSPWYPWLNSLPRLFNNGAALTPSCYDCLPPLAAKLSMAERVNLINCRQALKTVDFVSDEVKNDEALTKWVYNVVETRSVDVGGEKIIIPMADMFNHGSSGHDVEISYDEEGSCAVYTTTDVSAGYPLRLSYGDTYLTNPSATFAKYGFVDETSSSTFCKMMDIKPSSELRDIGLSFSRMLFYNTGDVSEEVYDVLLYQILASDLPSRKDFYTACMNGDATTKSAYHQQYMGETMGRLKKHVDSFLENLDDLERTASLKDVEKHPRLPLIRAHNDFVRQTFLRVKEQVDPVAAQWNSYT